jgi:hypothetical protein
MAVSPFDDDDMPLPLSAVTLDYCRRQQAELLARMATVLSDDDDFQTFAKRYQSKVFSFYSQCVTQQASEA